MTGRQWNRGLGANCRVSSLSLSLSPLGWRAGEEGEKRGRPRLIMAHQRSDSQGKGPVSPREQPNQVGSGSGQRVVDGVSRSNDAFAPSGSRVSGEPPNHIAGFFVVERLHSGPRESAIGFGIPL